MILLWIVSFSLLGSIGAVLVASGLLVLPDSRRRRLVPSLVSYATGAFLGAAFLGLIPQAMDSLLPDVALAAVMGGIIFFFVLEKMVIWHHCHDEDCEVHAAAGPMVLLGSALHNLVDGIIIVVAFMVSVPLGITASLAVVAHAVPHEAGKLAVLLESGYAPRRALTLSLLASLAMLAGAIFGYLFLQSVAFLSPYIMAIAAASFIYVAIADLIPDLHQEVSVAHGMRQVGLMLLGVGTIATGHLLG